MSNTFELTTGDAWHRFEDNHTGGNFSLRVYVPDSIYDTVVGDFTTTDADYRVDTTHPDVVVESNRPCSDDCMFYDHEHDRVPESEVPPDGL